MSKLKGMKWGEVKKEVQEELLRNCNCIDGSIFQNTFIGECIIDLTENLSVAGKIINDEIIIDDEAIIYDPVEGIL